MPISIRSATLASTLLAAVAAIGLAAAQAEPAKAAPPEKAAPQNAEVGKAAPAWTLTDTNGVTHNLSDFKGRIVVMEWFSAYCPWSGAEGDGSVHHNGKVKRLAEQLRKVDPEVVYLLVDSTHDGFMGKGKDDKIKDSHAVLAKTGVALPVLMDYSGTVGKAYGARTTPHMFVIDADGMLRYQGAFDADRNGRDKDAANHVLDAVKAIKAGGSVEPSTTRPWGCSVKYKG
jgi:peroxiredoxin